MRQKEFINQNNMTPKEQAKELVDKFYYIPNSQGIFMMQDYQVKECALIAVQYIINANPHSNPFNTEVHSTMDWWMEVKQEIEKL